MTLPPYVKMKPRLWNYLPWLSGSANTIYPYIYLPQNLFLDLVKSEPSPHSLGTLVHEETHLARQKNMGIVKYAIRYIFDRIFRFEEEVAAIRPQVQFLKSHGIEFDIQTRAKQLASSEYLWCTSFSKAYTHLEKILKEPVV